jgi:hypothetical protein
VQPVGTGIATISFKGSLMVITVTKVFRKTCSFCFFLVFYSAVCAAQSNPYAEAIRAEKGGNLEINLSLSQHWLEQATQAKENNL